MPLMINRPSVTETTQGVTFAIATLPSQTIGNLSVSIRKPTEYTLTAAAAALNAESISLTSNASFYLDAGTVLTFGTTKVTVTDGIMVLTTATTVQTMPIPAAISVSSTAKTLGLLFVVGAKKASLSPEIKAVEATNYLSGSGTEQVVTANGKKLSIETNLIFNDRGGDLLKKICYDPVFNGKEFWFELAFPSGERHTGAALITSASQESPLQELRSMTAEATVQGASYAYTPATVA